MSRRPSLAERLAANVTVSPAVAIAVAGLLLVASVAMALMNERASRDETVRQARVQAEILAGSIAAPLAFEDRGALGENLQAMRADPAVQAAGVYGPDGRLVSGFARDGAMPPAHSRPQAPAISDGALTVTRPVLQGTTRLGSVYLRLSSESLLKRVARYLGIAAVMVMASLLVAVLASSQAALNEAHRRLQAETRDREKAEEALRQAQKMEAMGQLTGGVAHDFNNLLMVASSGLELLERTDDPVRRERLRTGIRQAIDRGAALTQQLLAFARKTPLNAEVVDLGARVAGMREVLDRSLREDITVSVDVAPGLWLVDADPAQFEIAVLNMAINARDAMPNGGEIRIALKNVPAGEDGQAFVSVAISDTGEGIPEEALSRIFEPFFTTKTVGQGTGLGLSQVYGFARASGGDVKVESRRGVGTTFTLLLPRSERAKAPAAPPTAPAPAAAPARRRILVVEDDDRVAELVTEMVREIGYQVTRTTTAPAALERLENDGDYDLVFSDMVMPGEMNGLDLAHRIQVLRPGLPVLLTTGYSASASAAAAEGIRLLPKPYKIEALAAELASALQKGGEGGPNSNFPG